MAMGTGAKWEGGEEEPLKLTEDLEGQSQTPTLCHIGKVQTNKQFNAYGLLEVMKKAMKPTKGFIAKEVGPNLFSFQFRSESDMREVLDREPWHFDKNLLVLKVLKRGEQP
ncbi:hypothetical protein ACS0TY_033006 [Phlomoides rotata]